MQERISGLLRELRRAPRALALVPGLLVAGLAVSSPADPPLSPDDPPREGPYLSELEARVAVISRGLDMADSFYVAEVRPVEAFLRPFHADSTWVRRVAFALVREGRRAGVDPRVLASVVLVENPWLDPDIRSPVGAVGIMQIMPFHAGNWSACPSADLEDVNANVCYGARIFQTYLERTGGDVDRALLAYNGCVNGTNTPDCHLYPTHVYSRAGRAALKLWLGTGG